MGQNLFAAGVKSLLSRGDIGVRVRRLMGPPSGDGVDSANDAASGLYFGWLSPHALAYYVRFRVKGA